MSRKGIIQNAIIIVLGVAIICMSVGYAAFDTNLDVKGSTTIQKANWDVHLENPVKTINSTVEQSQITVSPNVNQAGTEVNFAVNLRPGDVYEFTIDVKNAGSFNAKLSSYTLTATQNGTPIAISNGSNSFENADISYEVLGVEEDETLTRGQISTKTIRIKAKDGAEAESKYEFRFNMTYVQNQI